MYKYGTSAKGIRILDPLLQRWFWEELTGRTGGREKQQENDEQQGQILTQRV
jgi:hypothetical protein